MVVGEDVAVAVDDEPAAGARRDVSKSRGSGLRRTNLWPALRARRPLRGRVDVDDRGVDPLGDIGEIDDPGAERRPVPARWPAAARAVGAVVTTGVLNCPARIRPTRNATVVVKRR